MFLEYIYGPNVAGSAARPLILLEWIKALPNDAGPNFWRVVADVWSSCDLIPHIHFSVQLQRFRKDAPEIDLPAERVVFRGQDARQRLGLSWSLSREVAERFAKGHRGILNPEPAVFSMKIRREDVALSLSDRNEDEIVLFTMPHIRKNPTIEMIPYNCETAFAG
ncbi:hypothetical protein A9320_08545 [Ruegeria sp. PBVC088]|nr:hypothetical protein A9320_08545 [Ruegeria sp. PBVC088]